MTNHEGGVKDVSIVLGILRFSMPLGDMPIMPFLMADPHISITPISTFPLQRKLPEHQYT